MQNYTPAQLRSVIALADALEFVAVELMREWRKRNRPAPRPRGATLRPGGQTPLWNALVAAVAPLLRRRGAKTLLARELALDPSRITEYFVTRTAMPDAERTMELLIWLGRWQRGQRKA